MNRFLLGLCGLAAVACATTHHDGRVPAGPGPLIAVYKAVVEDGHGTARRVKLSVWADRPDRLHAELVPPVGGVAFTLDAGGGNACIVDVASGIAYVGDDGPDAIEALAGVRVSAADAVAALLEGASPSGLTVTRAGAAPGALPAELRIVDGVRSLTLNRVRFERGRTDSRRLGTGVPPERLVVRPLESLATDFAGGQDASRALP